MPEYRFFHISNKGKITASSSLVEAILAANLGGYIWVDFHQPTPEELKQLRDPLGLNPQALMDWDTSKEITRMEHYPRNTYLRLHSLKYAGKLTAEPIIFFVGEKFLLTFSNQASDNRSPLANFAPSVSIESGPAHLLYALLNLQINQTASLIESLVARTDQAEQALLSNPAQCDVAAVVKPRHDLRAVYRHMDNLKAVLTQICRKESPFIPEQAAVLFQSLHDYAANLQLKAEDCSDILTGMVEIHLSASLRKANETAQASQAALKQLALLITVIMPVILWLAFYALAQWPIVAPAVDGRFAFLIVIAGTALVGYVVYRLFGWSKNTHK